MIMVTEPGYPPALTVKIEKSLTFPERIEITLDRIYRIYKIIYPSRKSGKKMHPQKTLLPTTGTGCLPCCLRKPGKESGQSCESCLKPKEITAIFYGPFSCHQFYW